MPSDVKLISNVNIFLFFFSFFLFILLATVLFNGVIKLYIRYMKGYTAYMCL